MSQFINALRVQAAQQPLVNAFRWTADLRLRHEPLQHPCMHNCIHCDFLLLLLLLLFTTALNITVCVVIIYSLIIVCDYFIETRTRMVSMEKSGSYEEITVTCCDDVRQALIAEKGANCASILAFLLELHWRCCT